MTHPKEAEFLEALEKSRESIVIAAALFGALVEAVKKDIPQGQLVDLFTSGINLHRLFVSHELTLLFKKDDKEGRDLRAGILIAETLAAMKIKSELDRFFNFCEVMLGPHWKDGEKP